MGQENKAVRKLERGGSSLVDGGLLLSPSFWSLMNATNRSRNSGVSSGRAVITSGFCWDPAIPQLSCGPVEHRPANEAPPASAELNVPAGSRASFNIYNLIWPLNIFSLFLSCLALHRGTAHITWRHLEELCRWWSHLKEKISTLALVFQQWEKGWCWIRMNGNMD